MESQPQNPEFRNNPENCHPCEIHDLQAQKAQTSLHNCMIHMMNLYLYFNNGTGLIGNQKFIKCNTAATQKEDQNLVFKTNYRFMKVKSIAECFKGSISAILSTFIKLHVPSVIKILVLSFF